MSQTKRSSCDSCPPPPSASPAQSVVLLKCAPSCFSRNPVNVLQHLFELRYIDTIYLFQSFGVQGVPSFSQREPALCFKALKCYIRVAFFACRHVCSPKPPHVQKLRIKARKLDAQQTRKCNFTGKRARRQQKSSSCRFGSTRVRTRIRCLPRPARAHSKRARYCWSSRIWRQLFARSQDEKIDVFRVKVMLRVQNWERVGSST